jgi:hypothetical protein
MGYMLSNNKQFDGANAIDAALDCNALFEPQITGTLLPNGEKDESTFTVYREYDTGTQAVLNAGVKKGYHAGSYRSLLNTAEAMFPDSVTGMQVYEQGAVLVFTQEIDEPFTFGDGDSLTRHVMYTASLNSAFSTRAIGFSFRPFCTNQESQGTLQLAQKRTKNHDEMLFSKATIMAHAAEQFDRFISNATMLKGLTVTPSLKERVLDEVAPLIIDPDVAQKAINHAQNRRDGILYFYEEEAAVFGHNAYALYQAVQTYEYHTATKGKNQAIKQVSVITDPEKAQRRTNRAGEILLAAV